MKRRTDAHSRGSALPALLLSLLAAGAGYAAWEAWTLSLDQSPVLAGDMPGRAVPPPATQAAGKATEAPPASYAEMLARPLFNSTRRPIAPPKPKLVEQPPASPLPPLQAQLVGLAMSGSGGRALVRGSNERQGSWLSVGEELGGWRLSEINADRVVFMSGQGRQELHLVAPKKKAARVQLQ